MTMPGIIRFPVSQIIDKFEVEFMFLQTYSPEAIWNRHL